MVAMITKFKANDGREYDNPHSVEAHNKRLRTLEPKTMIKESSISYMPFDQILEGSGICNVIKNKYWIIHPEKGLLFFQNFIKSHQSLKNASPQCNANKEFVEKLKSKLYSEETEVRFIEIVIVPVNINDYTN